MDIEHVIDDVQVNCFMLGCILGLVINYPKLIHGCNSRDVVRSKFVDNDTCYRFKPRVVACGWQQGFPDLRDMLSSTDPASENGEQIDGRQATTVSGHYSGSPLRVTTPSS